MMLVFCGSLFLPRFFLRFFTAIILERRKEGGAAYGVLEALCS